MPSDATASPVSGSAPPDASDQLFDLQLQFNLFPACYAHLSWIEATGFLQLHDGPAPVASPFSIRRLSDALLRQNGLEHQFDFDFSDRAKRLALLDASHLERIGAFGAAILVRDQIRRTVRGTDIDAMRRCIGADAHLHALRWEGAAAEIFAPAPAADWSDPQSWQLYGATLVSACIPPSAPGVLHRLWLKYHRAWLRRRPNQRLNESQRLRLSELLLQVVHDACPQSRWLFAAETAGAAPTA